MSVGTATTSPPAAAKIAGQFAQSFRAACGQHDARTGLHKLGGQRAANAAARAGEDGSLAGEVTLHEF